MLAFIVLLNIQEVYSQELKESILKIQEMPTMPELSGDTAYWKIIVGKLGVVPNLIELLDDSTPTSAGIIYFGGNYTVGDIAFTAISEIIRGIPIQDFLKNWCEYDSTKAGGNYWDFVRESNSNRDKLKCWFAAWYKNNKDNLVWVKDDNMYRKEIKRNPEYFLHPAGGYYIIGKSR